MPALTPLETTVLALAALLTGLSALALLAQERGKRAAARLARANPALAPAGPSGAAPVRLTRQARRWPALGDMAAAFLGIDRALGPAARPPVVVAVALALAAGVGVAWVANLLLGTSGVTRLLVALGAGYGALRWAHANRKAAHLARLLEQFPDALGLVVRAVRAGVPVAEGIKMVAAELPAPIGREFRQVADAIAIGTDLEQALWDLARRTGLPEFRFFVVTVVLQRETGGNLTETLDNLADVIRKRRAVRQRAKALTAEARMSIMVLAVLPFVAGGGLWLINPDYLLKLFTTAEGRGLLAAALCSLGVGLGSMHLLIKRTLG